MLKLWKVLNSDGQQFNQYKKGKNHFSPEPTFVQKRGTLQHCFLGATYFSSTTVDRQQFFFFNFFFHFIFSISRFTVLARMTHYDKYQTVVDNPPKMAVIPFIFIYIYHYYYILWTNLSYLTDNLTIYFIVFCQTS
jgi:hypothetical protein